MTERSTRPLRILLISHGLPPESVGGVEQHVAGLAAALTAGGHDVTVLAKTAAAEHAQGTLIDTAAAGPAITRVVYRYEGLTGLAALYEAPVIEEALRALLRDRAFDVAHVHHLTGLSVGVLAVLSEHGIPTVMTLHDYWMICPRGQLWHHEATRCERATPGQCAPCLRATFGGWVPAGGDGERVVAAVHELCRRALASVDLLVVPSPAAIPPFAAFGMEAGRIRVVENAVDVEALRALPPAAAPPGRPLRVGYLGTLIPSKGLDVLVAAARGLPPGTVELRIHGNVVPYHGDVGFCTRVFSSLRPIDRVSYFGPYATGDLPAILAELDVVAAPALWAEAFGLTVREALAAGRPAVCSRIGGLAAAVRDGVDGLLVAPGDPDALGRALAALAADRTRLAEMARAAREGGRVRTFAAMAAELVELYRSA